VLWYWQRYLYTASSNSAKGGELGNSIILQAYEYLLFDDDKEQKTMWKNKKIIKEQMNRFFPKGEGEGGWGQ
jgi:hypothetical protein